MNGRMLALVAVIGVLGSKPSYAQTPVTGDYSPELSGLDGVVTNWMTQTGLPGITVAVAHNGQLVYEKGFGYSDPAALTQQMVPSARMRLDTNSVIVTQRALQQLILDGTLHAGDSVTQILNMTCNFSGCPDLPPYADPRMQQITIEDLLEETHCLDEDPTNNIPPANKQVGAALGLNRDATPGERIAYLWTQAYTMKPASACTVGVTNSFAHYGSEIAAEIIAKVVDPSITVASYPQVGDNYGSYIYNSVGLPIGTYFAQEQNAILYTHEGQTSFLTLPLPMEVTYNSQCVAGSCPAGGTCVSGTCMCVPEWDSWGANPPQVPCAYVPDFFDRPGSGTIVTSARDYVRFHTKYYSDGSAKPLDQTGLSGHGAGGGSLAGSLSIVTEYVDNGDSSIFSFIINGNNGNMPDGSSPANNLNASIQTFLNCSDATSGCTGPTSSGWPSVGAWPWSSDLDLFVDYALENRYYPTEYARDSGNGTLQYGSADGADDEKWQIQRTSDGYYRIMNRGTGNLISLEHPGADAETLAYNTTWLSEQWTLSQTADGFAQFFNRWTGETINVQDQTGSVERGGDSTWWTTDWMLVPMVSFRLQNRWQTPFGHAVYATESNGLVSYAALTDSASQKWRLQPNSDGYYVIVNQASGDAISTQDQEADAECVAYDGSLWSEQWKITTTPDGYVQFFDRWTPNGGAQDTLFIQDTTGDVERGPGNSTWWSEDWVLVPDN
jgi:hypothetical protein